jgi:outer membrane protein OmpA-like peptidoglycan-associated protein
VNDSNFPKQPPADNEDWSKTNYNYPAPKPPPDDWDKTVANVRREDIDFNKTYMPGAAASHQQNDWDKTQANIKLPQEASYGGAQEDFGATTPYFRLPDAERAKYQNIPPTPTQEAEQRRENERAKGGIPAWLWVSGGLLAMFLFAVLVLLVVYIFILRVSGFEQVVKGAPAGSSVSVNGAYWGTTSDDGSILLPTLKANETKRVEIKHPNWACEPQEIRGEDGVKSEPIIARCKQVANISDECVNIKAGAYKKSQDCANKALDELPAQFSVDDLLRAMNLYIIQFPSNKYEIPAENKVFLERAAGFMKKLPPQVVVEVGGHTDSVGDDAPNKTLSDNRAKAVKAALIASGVAPEMLTEKGYGEEKPKATNDTEDGKFQNRRIEYTAVKK